MVIVFQVSRRLEELRQEYEKQNRKKDESIGKQGEQPP